MCGIIFHQDVSLLKKTTQEPKAILNHRGPDDARIVMNDDFGLVFNRLAIMDLTHAGDQPFVRDEITVACNGEIYNFLEIRSMFTEYKFVSHSDCEVILPLYKEFGLEEALHRLDGEFAFVIYDQNKKQVLAARDPMGVRPLFYGYTSQKQKISFASEAKALVEVCDEVHPFPPGHYYEDGQFKCYLDLSDVKEFSKDTLEQVLPKIRKKLEAGVIKRLHSDAPVGFLLSGGLDSSLVCSIAQKHSDKPIRTFAIGMSTDAIDLKYAKQVADYLGTDHTEVIIEEKDVIEAISDVIYHLESWDITTIRASLGMYLICKAIHEQTDVKVLLTGEVSDELFGYKYTDFAPSPKEFQLEAQKRIRELYQYDILRADRCISAHCLEARVPFSDKRFVEYVMSIDPSLKMNTYNMGKYLLRKAFEGDYLPDVILYRDKAAFSDAVGHSLVECIKSYVEKNISDAEFQEKSKKYEYVTPISKESLYYREVFAKHYEKIEKSIPDFWMPNKTWENCNVNDPSARVLPNYGKSAE